jgi:hypothetical protein
MFGRCQFTETGQMLLSGIKGIHLTLVVVYMHGFIQRRAKPNMKV